jgi:hypothetical protein
MTDTEIRLPREPHVPGQQQRPVHPGASSASGSPA